MTTESELEELLDAVRAAPEIHQPSPFWQDLIEAGLRQLEESGFENFKRTVNTRYFNWRLLGIFRHQFAAIFRAWLRHPRMSVFRASFPHPRAETNDRSASFGPIEAWAYKTFVAMSESVIARQDSMDLLGKIEEPALGNPFLIEVDGHRVSQDLCNSIHEIYSIGGKAIRPGSSFAEIGAGYGRLGHVILKAIPDASYTVVDIPPALWISQRYLTTLYPDLPVFKCRPWTNYADIAEEFERARVRFVAAWQLELLPPKCFDYMVSISSLHEMTLAQVQNYFQLIQVHCRGRFYTKQWRVSIAQVNGCTLRETDYPVPAAWRTVYHRRHPIQRMFFEALYDVV